jgi:uncharacterized protein YjiS (DUF1127 family)
MQKNTDDTAAVNEIAALLARGVCRWRKTKEFRRENSLNQLDNSRNSRLYVHSEKTEQRRISHE